MSNDYCYPSRQILLGDWQWPSVSSDKRLCAGWPRLSGKTHTHVWRNLKNWRTSNYFIKSYYQNRSIIFLVQDIFRFLNIPLNKFYSGWLCTTVSGTTGAVSCSKEAILPQSKSNILSSSFPFCLEESAAILWQNIGEETVNDHLRRKKYHNVSQTTQL